MRLWLQGNLQAHQFIHAEYWKSNAPLVRPLIQQSTLWVVREGATVIAFCGLQQDFIADICLTNSMNVQRSIVAVTP